MLKHMPQPGLARTTRVCPTRLTTGLSKRRMVARCQAAPPTKERASAVAPTTSTAALSAQEPQKANLPKFMEANICRLYYFSKEQAHVFEELVASMINCRTALAAVSAATILLSIVQAEEHGGMASPAALFESDFTVGDVASWADTLMVAGLITYGVGPFQRVLKSRSNQMAYTFQGIGRLSLIFQQLSIGSIAVSMVTGLEAAAKYPPLVVGTSGVFFTVALVRSAAMWWTLNRHVTDDVEVSRTLNALRAEHHGDGELPDCNDLPLLDKWAAFLAFGVLLQYEEKLPRAVPAAAATANVPASTAAAVASSSSGGAGAFLEASVDEPSEVKRPSDSMMYEFSLTEERVLRGLTEASSTAGLALGLQAAITFMATVADVGVGEFPASVGDGINATNKALTAALLFSAATSFDRALHTANSNDVEHLVDGLGAKGLTGLFSSLSVLSWAVTLATFVSIALPIMEHDVLAKMVGDGLSHRGAEAVVEGLQWLRAIIRGI